MPLGIISTHCTMKQPDVATLQAAIWHEIQQSKNLVNMSADTGCNGRQMHREVNCKSPTEGVSQIDAFS